MSNPTGYLCVDGEYVYISHRIPRNIEGGAFALNSVNIHNILPEDVGRSAGGLLYWEPSDTKRRSGQYCLHLGDNALYFSSIDGVIALSDYLSQIIDNHGEDNK